MRSLATDRGLSDKQAEQGAAVQVLDQHALNIEPILSVIAEGGFSFQEINELRVGTFSADKSLAVWGFYGKTAASIN